MSAVFIPSEPALQDYWRALVMYGRNVASYKFALAKLLIELKPDEGQLVKLEEIAPVFAKNICEHLKLSDKQATSRSSRFLDYCRRYNKEELGHNELVDKTISLGFNNVIDAFHILGNKSINKQFYIDERNNHKGIKITTEFSELKNNPQFVNFEQEAESRWNLVETSWRLNISRSMLRVDCDESLNELVVYDGENKWTSITSSKKALNGYQRGYCFYCKERMIDLTDNTSSVDVDHFFPHVLKKSDFKNIDGIWNLVLACVECNRGHKGKFQNLPEIYLLERLHQRNEYLIGSNHPLQKTLILQTGDTENKRRDFLNDYYNKSRSILINTWKPSD